MKTYYIKYTKSKNIKDQIKKLNLDNINFVKFYDFNKINDFLKN